MDAGDGTRAGGRKSRRARNREEIVWFPLDQLERLELAILEQLDARRHSRRRDALSCALGLCGLRSGEVSQIVMNDLSIPLRRLTVRTLKGGPWRALELDASTLDELLCWRSSRRRLFAFAGHAASNLLLPNCRGEKVRREQWNAMAKRLIDSILPAGHGLTFHSLRHTCGMRVYSETNDPLFTQYVLGHADLKTTLIYARSLRSLPESCRVKLDRSRLEERLRVVPFASFG